MLSAGARSFRAYYGGDGTDTSGSSAELAQTVGATPSLTNGLRVGATYPVSGNVVAVADFNGDERADIALAGVGLKILFGNGDGTFQPPVLYSAVGTLTSIAVGDFNGDGKADVSLGGDHGVSVLLGKGDGTFQSARIYAPGGDIVALSDFNADGNTDIVDYGWGLLIGSGDGTFQLMGATGGIAVGDFNGDGRADLVSQSGMRIVNGTLISNIGAYLGNGDGTFQSTTSYVLGGQSFVGAVGDFNGDGKPDLIVSGQRVSVLLGNGDGTFQPPMYPSMFGNGYLVTSDFNEDGKMDLAIVSAYSGVSVFLGNGDGTFQGGPNIVGGASSAAIGDFNGDGKPDLAVVGASGLSVLLGADAMRLAFTAQPANSIAGITMLPVLVQVEDVNGNPVVTGGSVTLTSIPSAGCDFGPSSERCGDFQ